MLVQSLIVLILSVSQGNEQAVKKLDPLVKHIPLAQFPVTLATAGQRMLFSESARQVVGSTDHRQLETPLATRT